MHRLEEEIYRKELIKQNKSDIMNADLKGALKQLNRSYRTFEHKGKSMTKQQVKAVLEYGIKQGYEHTGQLSDEEIDKVLMSFNNGRAKFRFNGFSPLL